MRKLTDRDTDKTQAQIDSFASSSILNTNITQNSTVLKQIRCDFNMFCESLTDTNLLCQSIYKGFKAVSAI